MIPPLHHLGRSPHLRILAMLAWLLLAVPPVHGMPAGQMDDVQHPASHAGSIPTEEHADHATTAHACCAGHDGVAGDHLCACTASCINVLIAAISEWAGSGVTSVQWPLHAAAVPNSHSAPPLRPPAP